MSIVLAVIRNFLMVVFLCSGMLLNKLEVKECTTLKSTVVRGELMSVNEYKIDERVVELEELVEELYYKLEALKERLNAIELEYEEQ